MLMHRPHRNYRLNVDDMMIDAYAEAVVKQFQSLEEANSTKKKKQGLNTADVMGSVRRMREEQLKNKDTAVWMTVDTVLDKPEVDAPYNTPESADDYNEMPKFIHGSSQNSQQGNPPQLGQIN